jgi:hypothetical protein
VIGYIEVDSEIDVALLIELAAWWTDSPEEVDPDGGVAGVDQ